MVGPSRRRTFIDHACGNLGVSERRACRALAQHRSTQWRRPKTADDEAALFGDIIRLATRYGRYGYRRVTALLKAEG